MFDKVFLTYSKDEPPILKNVSFVLRPAEKVIYVITTELGPHLMLLNIRYPSFIIQFQRSQVCSLVTLCLVNIFDNLDLNSLVPKWGFSVFKHSVKKVMKKYKVISLTVVSLQKLPNNLVTSIKNKTVEVN